jgi:hypothetical protein
VILEKNTTTFFGGKQVEEIMFDVVASNVIGIIGMDVHASSEKDVSLEVFAKAGSYLVTRTIESGHSCQRMISTRSLSTETARLRFTSPFKEDEMLYSSGQFFTSAGANDVMTVPRGVRRDYPVGDSHPPVLRILACQHPSIQTLQPLL